MPSTTPYHLATCYRGLAEYLAGLIEDYTRAARSHSGLLCVKIACTPHSSVGAGLPRTSRYAVLSLATTAINGKPAQEVLF